MLQLGAKIEEIWEFCLSFILRRQLKEIGIATPLLVLYPVYTIQPVVKPVIKPGFLYTIQPVVNPGCATGLTTVLNEQPLFINRVEQTTTVHQPCGTNSHCSFNRLSNRVVHRFDNRLYTRYSQLSNRLLNGFDNRLNVCIHDTTGCQTVLTTGLDNRLYRVNGALNPHDVGKFLECRLSDVRVSEKVYFRRTTP